METKLYATSDLHLFFKYMLNARKQDGLLPSTILTDGDFMEYIKERWNATVWPSNDVLFLGDLTYRSKLETQEEIIKKMKEYIKAFEFVKSLQGKKIWFLGDHDSDTIVKLKGLDKNMYDSKVWELREEFLNLMNEAFENIESNPMQLNNMIFSHEPVYAVPEGHINYHGHIHNGMTNLIFSNSDRHFNVNIELNDFKPVEVKYEWKKK